MAHDLDAMDPEALIAEVRKLRAGIRKHPDLWSLLPEKSGTLDRGSALAEIHARLHPLSPIARPAGAGRSRS